MGPVWGSRLGLRSPREVAVDAVALALVGAMPAGVGRGCPSGASAARRLAEGGHVVAPRGPVVTLRWRDRASGETRWEVLGRPGGRRSCAPAARASPTAASTRAGPIRTAFDPAGDRAARERPARESGCAPRRRRAGPGAGASPGPTALPRSRRWRVGARHRSVRRQPDDRWLSRLPEGQRLEHRHHELPGGPTEVRRLHRLPRHHDTMAWIRLGSLRRLRHPLPNRLGRPAARADQVPRGPRHRRPK